MNRRGPAAVGAAALATMMALVAWQAGQPTAPPTVDPERLQPARVEPPQANPQPIPVQAAASPPRSRAPGAGREPFDPTAAWAFTSPPRPGEVEYCGIGTAAADSPAGNALAQRNAEQTERAAGRLFGVMARSADPRTRAAARMARDEHADLADTARLTQDATVYAMALQTCARRSDTNPRSASCSALGAQQLARLDPDNAVPWLYVADEALQRKDAIGVAEALYRASLAQTSRVREFAFADLALSALPADWSQLDRLRASEAVLGVHAALTLPSYLAAVQYCAKERMADANLQQTCDRLARVLMERGDTVIDYGIGRRIGEQAGWPADVVESNNARFAAYMRALADTEFIRSGPAALNGCIALRRGVQLALEHSRHSERAYAQSQVMALGVSHATLIDRYRTMLRQRTPTPAASAPN